MAQHSSILYKLPSEIAYTILVVDDSETDQAIYQRYLKKSSLSHCSLLSSDCGEQGLALAQESSPDLILLDYMLPDFDGLEFLRALAEMSGPMPPVIMLTGEGDERVAVEAMKIGVRDYLIKAELTATRLTQAIQRVLGQQALQQLVTRQERQQQLMAAVALRINRAEGIAETLQTATEGVRELLDCDRTVIYQFESDMNGTIVAESVLPEFVASLGLEIVDTCFQTNGAARYLQNHKTIIADIHNSHLTPCHIQMLSQFQVKANLVVPIVLRESETQQQRLWGLLIAHQCRAVRDWRPFELALLDDLAVQLAIALRQNELVTTLKDRAAELILANQQLSTTAQLLETRNQELDEFSYVASHDLRAPLRAIANLASWIEEDLDGKIPAENQTQLGLIQSRAQRLDGFITGLLQYSKVGRESIQTEWVDIRALLNDIIGDLAPASGMTITVPETMPQIQAQKLLLQQVFANLISNAIKYHHRQDGNITLTAEDFTTKEQQDWIAFSVSDDGPGIEPTYHEKIFGIFQMLNSRDDVEGTGIGLSIVKKIVEQQGGQITLCSALGEGSTFRFTWPKISA